MKIIFICGSLEPGRDGVGDYTRLLAAELIRLTHHTTVIAINDKYIDALSEEEQKVEEVTVPVVRLPSDIKESLRFDYVRKKALALDPDWISLQFVPFSFQKKGLPFSLIKQLKPFVTAHKYKWHIMFHELWVGIYGHNTLKQRILGCFQKILINRMLAVMKPEYVTTSLDIYKRNLKYSSVKVLPLFSNIRVAEYPGKSPDINYDNRKLTAVHFGTFTGALDDFEKQIRFIAHIAEKAGKKACFKILGDGGSYKKEAIAISEKILGEKEVLDLGVMPEESVSRHLLSSDIGISRADFMLFGKSGSAMAMLEHGLPVLLRGSRPTDQSLLNHSQFYSQLVFCNDYLSGILIKRDPFFFIVKDISNIFISDLKKNDPGAGSDE